MEPKAGSYAARWVTLALTIALLVVLFSLGQREERRLRALLVRGQPAVATVTEITDSSGKRLAHFTYTVGGVAHRWDVEADKVPGVGGTFTLTYLPGKPSDHWVGPPLTEQLIRQELREGRVVYLLPAVACIMFLANEYQLRRRRQGSPRGVPSIPFTRWAFTIGLYAILIGSALASDEVFVKAFGATPLGMPNRQFVVLLLTVLYLPAIWIMPHVAALVVRSNPTGELLTRGQLNDNMAVLIAYDAAMRRSNRIAMAGVVYLLALAIAWIVYASYRGI